MIFYKVWPKVVAVEEWNVIISFRFYEIIFFCYKFFKQKKKFCKFWKINDTILFPDTENLWLNFIKNRYFLKKAFFNEKKSFENFQKLMIPFYSLTPKTFGETLLQVGIFPKKILF